MQSSGSESVLSVQPFPGSSSSSEGSSPDVLGLPPFPPEEGHSDSVFDPPYAVRQDYSKDSRCVEWSGVCGHGYVYAEWAHLGMGRAG